MRGIFIGLGSNLGDRLQNLRRAVDELGARGVSCVMASSVYETAPVGKEEQPDFLNAVIEVETSLTPEELLSVCMEVERVLGRVRVERWGPRVVDVDVLLYDDLRIESEMLVVPHPRLFERRFVLAPLVEIAPNLFLTKVGHVRDYLEQTNDQVVKKGGRLLPTVKSPDALD